MKRPKQDDRLRSQFTSWLTTLLWRARIDYVRKQNRTIQTVSLEEANEAKLACEDRYAALQSEFEFEEERLARAFFSLPIQRKRVITLLYFEQLTPEETAKELGCTVDQVYKIRSRTLQSLRRMLNDMEGDK